MKAIQIKSMVYVFLTAMIWGASFVAQQVGMDHIGPWTFATLRMLLGGLVLLPFLLYQGRRKPRAEQSPVGWRTVLLGGGLSGLCLGLGTITQQIALQSTTVAKAGFIAALYIVMVPIVGLFFRKKVGAKLWVCVLIATVGLYFLCITDTFRLSIGDSLMVASALCFALQILSIDSFVDKMDGLLLSCVQFFAAAIVCAVGMVCFETLPTANAVLATWMPLAYTGILSTGVAFTLQTLGQKNLSPTVTGMILSLEALTAALAGWVLLGQGMSPRELLGGALMFGAIMLAQIPTKAERASLKNPVA